MDKFGRVLIPKAARKKVGLEGGAELDIDVSDGQITIKPAESKGRLVREGLLLVWDSGAGPSDYDIPALIEQQRNERMMEHLELANDEL